MNSREKQIDEALELLARVEPRAGLERRVRARLAQQKHPPVRNRLLPLQRWGVGIAAVAASLAIVAGSVRHSRETEVAPPTVQLGPAASGIGTASAARIPAQAIPAPVKKHGRWQHKRTRGRAELKEAPTHSAGVQPAPPDPQR